MFFNLIINTIFGALTMLPIYLIASLGGYLSPQVGIYDVSMEGNMTLGCILGIIGCYTTNSPFVGLLMGFMGGYLFGIILSVLAVKYNLEQLVIGFGLWFVGIGFSNFLYNVYIHEEKALPTFPPIAKYLGVNKELSGFARFLELDIVFYFSVVLLVAIIIIINKTKLGVWMRAAGEAPNVVDAAGINIFRLRLLTVQLGCALVGTAGAYLAIAFLQGFTTGMVGGRGWIAWAIVIFSRWKPLNLLWGCLLFAGINGLQMRLQTIGVNLPYQLMTAFPYIATLLALSIVMYRTGKSGIPSALGVPYFRE